VFDRVGRGEQIYVLCMSEHLVQNRQLKMSEPPPMLWMTYGMRWS